MSFDPSRDYPIGAKRPTLVHTPGGIPLDELELHGDGVEASELRGLEVIYRGRLWPSGRRRLWPGGRPRQDHRRSNAQAAEDEDASIGLSR